MKEIKNEVVKPERYYIDNFDAKKEYELFMKEYNYSFIESEKIKDMLVDRILGSFLMDRIHPDYKKMISEYHNLKETEKENQELKGFIRCLLSNSKIEKDNEFIYTIIMNRPFIKIFAGDFGCAEKMLKEWLKNE